MFIDKNTDKFNEKSFSTTKKEYKQSNEINFGGTQNFDESTRIEDHDENVEFSNGVENE
jgi:hypothetical protein